MKTIQVVTTDKIRRLPVWRRHNPGQAGRSGEGVPFIDFRPSPWARLPYSQMRPGIFMATASRGQATAQKKQEIQALETARMG